MDSFYTVEELNQIGFKKFGVDVKISRRASIYGAENISIGNHVRIDDFCILSGHIELENYIHIAAYAALYGGQEGIFMSDFAGVSSRVCIYSVSDDYSGEAMTNPMVPDIYRNVESKPVYIGRHVLIGSTSVVVPGVHLAEGSAFGSFSFITEDSKEWGIYIGIPAKRVKERSKKLLEYERNLKEI